MQNASKQDSKTIDTLLYTYKYQTLGFNIELQHEY